MNLIKLLLEAEYVALIVSCYLNAYMFFRTKDGMLRKLLIAFFTSLATAALGRLLFFSLEWNSDILMGAIMLFLSGSSVWLNIYMHKQYMNQNKKSDGT